MNRILITGATGTIGRSLVTALRDQGTPFETLGSPTAAEPGPRAARYDDPAGLARAFEGITTLFVLLPLTPAKLAQARNVATAARTAGVRHIVRSSGAGADPQAGYALPRLQGEVDKIFEDTGLATTFLRPAGFMQNYLSFQADRVRAGTVHAATGDAPQSLVDTRDIAAVAARILAEPAPHAGKAYTLTGGEALTDSQRLQVLSDVTGRPVTFVPVPAQAAIASMKQMGLPEVMIGWLSSLDALVAAGHAAAISPDVQVLLGRAPISFRQFATEHRQHWA